MQFHLIKKQCASLFLIKHSSDNLYSEHYLVIDLNKIYSCKVQPVIDAWHIAKTSDTLSVQHKSLGHNRQL